VTDANTRRTANVIGLGLIGGSLALALQEQGWEVGGEDLDPAVTKAALERGVIRHQGMAPNAVVTFVAVPVQSIPAQVRRALDETEGIVTDVGSVKGSICAQFSDPRFIGGHPMAGSELDGLDGADGSLFEGAIWVLTPDLDSPDLLFAELAQIISTLGADVVALDPFRHDEVVAVISHVPHLTAATLMGLASDRSQEHAALLRLAAGGFRDMTRIASGRAEIWLDICEENRPAIVKGLDGLISGLSEIREIVETGNRSGLLTRLSRAREARANLPGRVTDPTTLAEFRIPIPDRPGAAAEVFTLAAELGVNIANFEVVHMAEANRGVVVVVVDAEATELFRGGLMARGFRPSAVALG
jgi:prephenate dehydrogenase